MPKRGGRLALKGFLISFTLAVVIAAAAKGHKNTVSVGMVIAYATGSAYILLTLRNWDKNKQPVRGAAIGWIVACFLIMLCIGGLAGVATDATTTGKSTSSAASSTTTAQTIPAKYDEAKAVIGLCGKPTKDHPQELHAGAGSEGRALVYRKYNTELWFYRGPESPQWMFMNAFEPKGDDTITVQEANTRMPCLKDTLQEHIREPRNAEEKAAAEAAQVAAQNAEAAHKASDDKKYSDLSTRAAIGAASLKAAARNPDSLKLAKVLGMDDGTICYEYRAQNGFGGMNQEIAVLLPGANSLTTSTAAWNKHCAHKQGYDVKGNAETLMKLVPE